MKNRRSFASLLLTLFLLSFASPALAALPELTVNSPVLIVGRYAPGGSIRATYPTDQQLSVNVEWRANSDVVLSGPETSLPLTNDMVGKVISAKITLGAPGFGDKVVEVVGETVSSALPEAAGSMGYMGESVTLPGCFAPRQEQLTGPKVGWPIWISCNPYNTSFGAPITQTYSWYRNGQLLTEEHSSQYRLKESDAGQEFWGAYKTVWANGYVFTEAKKLKQAIPYVIKVTQPTIRGAFKNRGRLYAVTTGWDSEATLSFQWFSDFAPIEGATAQTYRLKKTDLDKNIQVLVTATRPGFSSVSRVSEPVVDADVAPMNPAAAYQKIYQSYTPTNRSYDINYITSPSMTSEALAHEQSLIQKAADFWSQEFTPSGVTVVYLTKNDTDWAEALIQQHPSWSSGIPGGIRSWIEGRNCGFALAFMAEQKQVFVQCVHLGADHSINDDQVSIHEYSHWFQYEQNSSLFSITTPWLIEGQANFYGLALGVAPDDQNLDFVNFSLAGHATQWDLYNGYTWGDFKLLKLFETGDTFDTSTLLARSGLVWDSYYIGGIASEWLITNYGHAKYVQWTKALLKNKGGTRETETIANQEAFSNAFGFEFSDFPARLTPYLAARSAQVREVWNTKREAEVNSSTVGSTQRIFSFAPAVTTLSKAQELWIKNRAADTQVKKITCRARYGTKSTFNEKVIFKARAKAVCGFAQKSRQDKLEITVDLAQANTDQEIGQIFVSFEN